MIAMFEPRPQTGTWRLNILQLALPGIPNPWSTSALDEEKRGSFQA